LAFTFPLLTDSIYTPSDRGTGTDTDTDTHLSQSKQRDWSSSSSEIAMSSTAGQVIKCKGEPPSPPAIFCYRILVWLGSLFLIWGWLYTVAWWFWGSFVTIFRICWFLLHFHLLANAKRFFFFLMVLVFEFPGLILFVGFKSLSFCKLNIQIVSDAWPCFSLFFSFKI